MQYNRVPLGSGQHENLPWRPHPALHFSLRAAVRYWSVSWWALLRSRNDHSIAGTNIQRLAWIKLRVSEEDATSVRYDVQLFATSAMKLGPSDSISAILEVKNGEELIVRAAVSQVRPTGALENIRERSSQRGSGEFHFCGETRIRPTLNLQVQLLLSRCSNLLRILV